jgi:hypothetical protein
VDEIYLGVQLDEDRVLCVAPLTNRNIELSGQDIEDKSGYFLFEKRGRDETQDVEILAHLISEEAALRMARMLNMA